MMGFLARLPDTTQKNRSLQKVSILLDLILKDGRLDVYTGEVEVRPPRAPNGPVLNSSPARAEISASAPNRLAGEPMTNGWTATRRKRQARAIRRWRPWEQSTGPRTPEGKALVSRNAWRGGERPRLRQLTNELNAAMRLQKKLRESFRTG
jgi:hypothetical protein